MNEELANKIRAFLEKYDALKGEPATLDEIVHAEDLLNIKFNDQYIEFIKMFGGSFGGINIYAFKNGSLIGKETVVDLTVGFRKAYGKNPNSSMKNSYAISVDISGNPILMNEKGNILLYLHDSNEVEILSNSLEELLTKTFLE
jgi:hypothetical protein